MNPTTETTTRPPVKKLCGEVLEAVTALRAALLRVDPQLVAEAADRLAWSLDLLEAAPLHECAHEERGEARRVIERIFELNRQNEILARGGLRGLTRWMRRLLPNAAVEAYGADGTLRYRPGTLWAAKAEAETENGEHP